MLYTFTGFADGGQPAGGVVRDSAGDMYETGSSSSSGGDGTLFKIDPTGKFSVNFTFDGEDGTNPYGKGSLHPLNSSY